MNPRLITRTLLFSLLSLILAACGGLTNLDQGTAGSGDFSVRVTNQTRQQICYLFVSSAEVQEWGEDFLGESGILTAGSEFTVRVATAGVYDLMAVTENPAGECQEGGEQITNYGFTIDGNETWSVT